MYGYRVHATFDPDTHAHENVSAKCGWNERKGSRRWTGSVGEKKERRKKCPRPRVNGAINSLLLSLTFLETNGKTRLHRVWCTCRAGVCTYGCRGTRMYAYWSDLVLNRTQASRVGGAPYGQHVNLSSIEPANYWIDVCHSVKNEEKRSGEPACAIVPLW